jgi:hypothetical protein
MATNYSTVDSARTPTGKLMQPNGPGLLKLTLPINVTGVDSLGHSFSESTSTEIVSPNGATFDCTRSLEANQEISLRFGNKQTLARVVGQTGVGEFSHYYGLVFLQDDPRFWGVSFPSPTSSRHPLVMQCSRCTNKLTCHMNEVEVLVLRANGQVKFPCTQCDEKNLLAETNPVPSSEASEDNDIFEFEDAGASAEDAELTFMEPDLVPVGAFHEADLYRPAQRHERRKNKRINLPNAKACIERPGAERDIVDVVNVSVSGALLISKVAYSLGDWIRIAIPYTIGGSNIFQSARIVRISHKDPYFAYGVEYVRAV